MPCLDTAALRSPSPAAPPLGVPAIISGGIYPGSSNVMAAHIIAIARQEYDADWNYRTPAPGGAPQRTEERMQDVRPLPGMRWGGLTAVVNNHAAHPCARPWRRGPHRHTHRHIHTHTHTYTGVLVQQALHVCGGTTARGRVAVRLASVAGLPSFVPLPPSPPIPLSSPIPSARRGPGAQVAALLVLYGRQRRRGAHHP
jgi:hypothetical protein